MALPESRYIPGCGMVRPSPCSPKADWLPLKIPFETNYKSCDCYLAGIDLFNYGFFWEAHAAWEWQWRLFTARSSEWIFFLALIKISAGFLQLIRGREKSFKFQLDRGISLLTQIPPTLGGIDLNLWIFALERERIGQRVDPEIRIRYIINRPFFPPPLLPILDPRIK